MHLIVKSCNLDEVNSSVIWMVFEFHLKTDLKMMQIDFYIQMKPMKMTKANETHRLISMMVQMIEAIELLVISYWLAFPEALE